jgi:RND family efflux transporter MFP subunit
MKTDVSLLSRTPFLAALLAALLTMMSACSRSGAAARTKDAADVAVPAGVVEVARRDLSNSLQIASEFIPYQEIDVHAKVSGYVEKLYINWGTHVQQGQLMAVLQVPELNAQVLRDEAAVLRDKQNLAGAREELDRAVSAYTVAHLTYTRMHGVQKSNPKLVAQEEVDVAYGKDMEGAAAVAAAKDALAAAKQQLAVDQDAMAKDQAMFDYARITAPFEGVVTELDAYTGSLLPAGTATSKAVLPLCHLSQTDLLRLVIPVPARIVPDVHLGETVSVQVPSLKNTFQGKVARFSGLINLNTRTMHTEVDVPNPKYEIVPGMYAYVQLPVRSAANALALPIQAVEFNGHDQGKVMLVSPQDEIEARHVQLGLQTANQVQIVSGLQEGDQVVFGELTRFHAGERIKPEKVNLAALEAGQ